MDTKPLEDLGMTQKEVDVYLALLNIKSASIFEVMNKARVSRKSIYEILQKLQDRGLVIHSMEDNKKQYTATNPEKLLEFVKEKERALTALLPEMISKYTANNDDTSVEFFIGKNGLKTVSNNILNVGKTIYSIGGEGKLFDALKYYTPQFIKERVRLKIKRKVVYNESVRQRDLRLPLTEVRYVPAEYESPVSISIYGDYVNILIISDNPVAIMIRSTQTADAFMNYFNLMWAIGKNRQNRDKNN